MHRFCVFVFVSGLWGTAAAQTTAPVETAAEPTPAPAVLVTAAAEVAEATVAVLDLTSIEQTKSVARALTVVVAAEVSATPGYRAVSRNDVKALLAHQTDAQLVGCSEMKCMADIGKLLEADLVLAGSVEQLDSALVFSLQLIDPAIPKVVERQAATWRDEPDRLVELARPFVDRLLAGTKAQHFEGSLEVFAPKGAQVMVDGNDVGAAPLAGPVQRLATGCHAVEITQEGFLPFYRDVVVIRGEKTLLRAELIDADSVRPWYTRWWVWGSIGGGLVVVGGTAAAVAAYAILGGPQPTTVEVTSDLPLGVLR